MKEITLLTWLTQLGLSVAVPLAGWICLALWLQNRFSLDGWCIWVGIALGFVSALSGLVRSLKTLAMLTKEKNEQHPVSFNDHD